MLITHLGAVGIFPKLLCRVGFLPAELLTDSVCVCVCVTVNRSEHYSRLFTTLFCRKSEV